MKKQRKIPVFYIVYFACILVFLIAVQAALGIVRSYLADYEAAQPQHEAQRIYEEYYAGGNFGSLLDCMDVSVSPLESRAELERYLQEYTSGKTLAYNSITTGLDDTLKYIVKADDVKFSSFTLEKSGESSPKGFDLYAAGSFELYCPGRISIRLTAPKGYSVYVNDVLLDDAYLTGKEQRDISCQHMPDGVEGIVYVEYGADDLYYYPENVRVVSPDGRDVPVTTEGSGAYSASILYSDELAEQYSDYAIAAAQALSAYMQNDGRFSAAAAYIDPNSELYVNIRTSETYFVIPHSTYTFEDMRTSEFYAYNEDTFSCRVTFTHILKRTGSEDYRDYIDMTFFWRRCGDKFLIYDRYNH